MSPRKSMLLLALVLVLAGCGGGTLQPILDEGGETYGFGNFSTGSDKSFGVFICADGGPVEITSVEPELLEGDIRFLGALVYTSADRFVGAANGFPPDGIDESLVEPAEGAVVEADCSDSTGDKVQLLIGAERMASGGGVLDDFVVATDNGDVPVDLTILLCGDGMEYCEALIPADETTTTTSP